MINIPRQNKPEILSKREVEWLDNFIASGKLRPDSSKYAHREIRDKLMQMSYNKCFYSEYKFSENEGEVDHYIEVNSDKNGAFRWDNLFLSLKQINNGKIPHSAIPVSNTLDPCSDLNETIEEHLYFENGEISSDTSKGLDTIKKYKLNHPLLNLQRKDKLLHFHTTLNELHNNQIKENGRDLTQSEIIILRRFAAPDYPFSLMFRLLLRKLGIS